MKIEKTQSKNKRLKEVKVGECFVAVRSGRHKNEVGYYLKIDAVNPSQFFRFRSLYSPHIAAVNLETGFVRFFTGDEMEQLVRVVEPYLEYC